MKSGKAEGIKQGTEQGIQQVALNMLKQKIDIEIISNTTGLSKEDLKNLKNLKE